MIQKKVRQHLEKPVFVLASSGDLKSFPFNEEGYVRAYNDLCHELSREFSVFMTDADGEYLGSGSWSQGWYYDGKKFVRHQKRIYARVVFDKGNFLLRGGKGWSVVNSVGLNALCKHKYRSYRVFREFYKPTYWVRNHEELLKAIKKVKTELVVYKPLRGMAGRGVIIDTKEQIVERLKGVQSGIIQTFIDTKEGIPNFLKGIHDFRIVLMNGEIAEAYARIPKKGSLVANWAQGGSVREVPLEKIPLSAIQIMKQVDAYMKRYGSRIYAIDMGFENGKPYIIELNRGPGIPWESVQPLHYRRWLSHARDAFLKAVN